MKHCMARIWTSAYLPPASANHYTTEPCINSKIVKWHKPKTWKIDKYGQGVLWFNSLFEIQQYCQCRTQGAFSK